MGRLSDFNPVRSGEITVRRTWWAHGVCMVMRGNAPGSRDGWAQIRFKGIPIPMTLATDDVHADDWEEC